MDKQFVTGGWRTWLIVGVLLTWSLPAATQSVIGPRIAGPASYGPPLAAQLQGHEATLLSNGFNFWIHANVTDVQRLLPPGFVPVPEDGIGTTTNITAIFSSQVMLTLHSPVGGFSPGTYGPYDSFDLAVGAFNVAAGRAESVAFARFVNNVEIAELLNALRGAGSTRFAEISVQSATESGQRTMSGRVADEGLGLRVAAKMRGLDQVEASLRQVFVPLPLRTTLFSNSLPTDGGAFAFSVSTDNSPSPTGTDALEVPALRIRTGAAPRLPVSAVTPGVFSLNLEVHLKRQ